MLQHVQIVMLTFIR